MSTFFLLISAICFIAAFGVHMQGKTSAGGWCPYMDVPWMSAIPWVCGFVLAVIPESFIFDIEWWWIFLINILVVTILGPFLTGFVMRRIASSKGAGVDSIVSMIIAIVTLIIGIII